MSDEEHRMRREQVAEVITISRDWWLTTRALISELSAELERVGAILNAQGVRGEHLSPSQRVELLVEKLHGAHFTRRPTRPDLVAVVIDDNEKAEPVEVREGDTATVDETVRFLLDDD